MRECVNVIVVAALGKESANAYTEKCLKKFQPASEGAVGPPVRFLNAALTNIKTAVTVTGCAARTGNFHQSKPDSMISTTIPANTSSIGTAEAILNHRLEPSHWPALEKAHSVIHHTAIRVDAPIAIWRAWKTIARHSSWEAGSRHALNLSYAREQKAMATRDSARTVTLHTQLSPVKTLRKGTR